MAQGGPGSKGRLRTRSEHFDLKTDRKKKSHHVALLSSFPFSSSFDVCQKDRKGKCERIAPTWWLFLGGFLLGGVVVLVVVVVVSGRGMHMHMHVHMIIWLNHKSPELGLNLSGS